MKKILCCLILVSTMLSGTFGQIGSIRGKVIDSITNETLPGANAYIEIGKVLIGASTDAYGYFHIKGLNPGVYNVNISYIGYNKKIITTVRVNYNEMTSLEDIYLTTKNDLNPIEIVEYTDKLIGAKPLEVIRSKDIKNIPNSKNLTYLLNAITPGVLVSDDGREVYFRGARNGGVVYYVDGVKQRDGEYKIPSTAVASIMVYMGDVPAKYGDFDGGVVVVETKSYFDLEAERMAAKKR
ncbi:MAG: carboxypeptidase-like regulatory domain-containing protein [Bacteroidales bacterium]